MREYKEFVNKLDQFNKYLMFEYKLVISDVINLGSRYIFEC